MEWDELIKAIDREWNKNRKNARIRFDNIYKLFEQIQPDNNNLLQALKAECVSELQVAQTLEIYTVTITIGFGLLTMILNYSISVKDIVSILFYGVLDTLFLAGIAFLSLKLLKGTKKSRFVISVIEVYESDNKKQ